MALLDLFEAERAARLTAIDWARNSTSLSAIFSATRFSAMALQDEDGLVERIRPRAAK